MEAIVATFLEGLSLTKRNIGTPMAIPNCLELRVVIKHPLTELYTFAIAFTKRSHIHPVHHVRPKQNGQPKLQVQSSGEENPNSHS